jgi:ketosteroid isomerase-like protein
MHNPAGATVPSPQTLERFVARVEEGAHADAVLEFYTEDASMQENQDAVRVGRSNHEAMERKVLARAKRVHSACIRPVLVAGDIVVIRWKFRFDWLDGTSTEMEELAYQRWQGERIAQEQFFYDPAQRQARLAGGAPPP